MNEGFFWKTRAKYNETLFVMLVLELCLQIYGSSDPTMIYAATCEWSFVLSYG